MPDHGEVPQQGVVTLDEVTSGYNDYGGGRQRR
jgi:hypothetical protein